MRLPYIQVSQDIFDVLAPALSVVLEISEGEAALHLLRLWKCLIDTGREDRPPDGFVQGAKAGALIERAVRWTGQPGAFVAACMEPSLQLIEALPGCLRIKGSSRYEATWEKSKAARDRMAKYRVTRTLREQNANGARTERAQNAHVHPETQTQTQTYVLETPLPKKPQVGQPAPNPPVPPIATQRATERPSLQLPPDTSVPLRDRMEEAWLKGRGGPYAWSFGDDQAMRRLLQLGAPEAILERWVRALGWVGFPQVHNLQHLATHWNAFAAAQPRRPAGRGRASEEDKDWSKPQPTKVTEYGVELDLGGGDK